MANERREQEGAHPASSNEGVRGRVRLGSRDRRHGVLRRRGGRGQPEVGTAPGQRGVEAPAARGQPKSGESTLDGGTVKDVHGNAGHQPGCASGSFSVKGQFRIHQLTFAGKYLAVSGLSDPGHNQLGGLAAVPIHLKVAGTIRSTRP